MKEILAGNMLIAQSGGPTVVINQSLVGALLEAKKHKCISNIYGALHGIDGILNENLIDLRKESTRTLDTVAATPSSALGSVRKKPSSAECEAIFRVLHKYDVRFFFYIGGNDSAETVHIINMEARRQNHQLRCFHIPKTVDNDLRENDHTPGFASAAKFVACALMGDNLDNRAMGGVKIDVIMGRHAGFLTAASALARFHDDDGPHLVYLPERPFSIPKFVADVRGVYKRLGRCVVAVSEGIADRNGAPIASRFTSEVDSHGNAQLGGSGALGDFLASELKARSRISRVRADTFGYLQRCFPGVVSENDASEARAVGAVAVREAATGCESGSIAIRRKPTGKYQVYYERVALKKVARNTRHVPARFINKAGNNITKAFVAYAAPIVGELPRVGRLKGIAAER